MVSVSLVLILIYLLSLVISKECAIDYVIYAYLNTRITKCLNSFMANTLVHLTTSLNDGNRSGKQHEDRH